MSKQILEPKPTITMRLVKGEDLNHHGTLFAGRTAEWFVESGFIAAASLVDPQHVVCLKIHGMYFTKPARPGQILKFTSKIVLAGRSSLIAHIDVIRAGSVEEPFVSGFITFIYVDDTTKPISHNLEIVPKSDEDIKLHEMAKALKK
ncbi:MAG TPA: hotdog domain-containing protein [Williamwhitmania sp.]|nr:hotdog domain-containing protein [Williamwhitmania sp.]